MLRAFRRILDFVVDRSMLLAEIGIVLMMLHVTVEIISRSVLRIGLEAVNEITAYYYMSAVTFFALGYVTRTDGHISAQFFTAWMPPRAREILEGVIAIVLCAYMVLLVWQTGHEALAMTGVGEVHQAANLYLPKWPPRWFLPIGSAIMALAALAIAIDKLAGRPAGAASGGPPAPAPLVD
jgi:TRAP-type C4-dicarboxylate transport system permease small subunit